MRRNWRENMAKSKGNFSAEEVMQLQETFGKHLTDSINYTQTAVDNNEALRHSTWRITTDNTTSPLTRKVDTTPVWTEDLSLLVGRIADSQVLKLAELIIDEIDKRDL
jgi:hypothetical protein